MKSILLKSIIISLISLFLLSIYSCNYNLLVHKSNILIKKKGVFLIRQNQLFFIEKKLNNEYKINDIFSSTNFGDGFVMDNVYLQHGLSSNNFDKIDTICSNSILNDIKNEEINISKDSIILKFLPVEIYYTENKRYKKKNYLNFNFTLGTNIYSSKISTEYYKYITIQYFNPIYKKPVYIY